MDGPGAMRWIVVLGCLIAATESAGVVAAQSGETPYQELTGRWEKVPKAPWGAQSPDAFVDDGDLIVMDRYGSGRMLRYDVRSRSWSGLPKVPQRISSIGPSAWTGEVFVVFDALEPDGIVAFDPDASRWRPLPASPLAGHDFATAGGGQLAAIHVDRSDGVDLERSLAVLDVAGGTWTEFPPPAGRDTLVDLFAWDGGLVAVTADEARSLVHVESLDFETGTWSEPQVVPVRPYHARAAWAGDRLVWSGDDSLVGRADATYDAVAKTVTDEDYDCPLTTRAALWTGDLLVSTSGTSVLDPETGECRRLPGADRTMGGSAAAAWTGNRVIYWSGGGAEEGVPDPYRLRGMAFVPAVATGVEGDD